MSVTKLADKSLIIDNGNSCKLGGVDVHLDEALPIPDHTPPDGHEIGWDEQDHSWRTTSNPVDGEDCENCDVD